MVKKTIPKPPRKRASASRVYSTLYGYAEAPRAYEEHYNHYKSGALLAAKHSVRDSQVASLAEE